MIKHNACLVSNDDELAFRLQESLSAQQEEVEFTRTQLDDLVGDRYPQEAPAVAFLDLRNGHPDELWTCLPRAQSRWRDISGYNVPLVGIVEEGLAANEAVRAEQSLYELVDFASAASHLPSIIRNGPSQQPELHSDCRDRCYAIQGTKSKFITYSPVLASLLEDIETIARRNFTVLLIGETGTGKTTLARIIHELSDRRDHRFVTVACGSLPGELVDSELFGHVRGAFTGAERDKDGKFVAANGGTILLDEIDVLKMMQQAKLLRVLESGEFEPVGSNETLKSNARTIVASNVCLYDLMEQQQFRPDLFYRLDQVRFEIPPLRKRRDDIIPIAVHFIEECCSEHDMAVPRIHPDFLKALKQYNWPGNIRELRNEVRRAVLFARNGILTHAVLSGNVRNEANSAALDSKQPTSASKSDLAFEVAQAERDAIEQMLAANDYNRAATARALGISRVTLYNKLRKYGIRANSQRRAD